MRFILGAFVAVFVSGCGIAHQMKINDEAKVAKAQFEADKATCEKQFPDPHRKPASPRVACMSNAGMRYYEAMDRSIGNPNLDLPRTLNAKLALAAETYDANRMTPAQYDLAKAQAISEFQAELRRRQNSDAMVNAAQTQAAAAVQANSPTTCTAIGNSVTCY